MTKAEKIGIALTGAALLISILAWQFPVSEAPKFMPTKTVTFEVNPSSIDLTSTKQPIQNLDSERISIEKVSESEKVLKNLEFSDFFYQYKTFSLDSGKLNYVRNTRHLLSRKLKFRELNVLLGELNMDSNKISLVILMQGTFEPPMENDLMNYTASFILDSNRQKALSLIY